MIILEVTVLGTGSEVGGKIGTPTPLRGATDAQASRAPQENSTVNG